MEDTINCNKYKQYIIDLLGGGFMNDDTKIPTTESLEKSIMDTLVFLWEDQTGKKWKWKKVVDPKEETA